MSLEEQLLARLDALIAIGEEVLASRRRPPPNVLSDNFVNGQRFAEWRAGSEAFLTAVVGPDHPYSVHFRDAKEARQGPTERGLGVLKAARSDIAGGLLVSVKSLAAAEMFSDFLDVARHLLTAGYKDPAASLVGAVLENGLRRMAVQAGLRVKSNDDVGSLDQRLADKDLYSRLTQRKVRLWKAIRDHADHGEFEEYSTAEVEQMLEGVSQFLELTPRTTRRTAP